MIESLLELPLFQGLGKADLARIAETVHFTPRSYEAGEEIARQDSACDKLDFLLQGTVTRHTRSADGSYAFSERITPPAVLQPEVLYGLNCRYTHSFVTQSTAQIMHVSKWDVNHTFMNYEVFRLNYLNLLSTLAVRRAHHVWEPAPGELIPRIVRFIRHHAQYPAGEKILHIKMETLAAHVQATRLNVSFALRDLQKQGLLLLRRGQIIVPALERLVAAHLI